MHLSMISFKIIITSLLSIIAFSAPRPIEQITPSDRFANMECEMENKVFVDGEKITYAIYYNLKPFWIKSGEVSFTMIDKGETYFVEAKGRTASSFEWFYKVRDTYTCEIDKKTLLPIRSTRNIREGGYRKVSTAEYDFSKNMVTAYSGKTEDTMKKFEIDMDDCMHDVLSIVYYARNFDYSKVETGTWIPANVFLDDEKYNVGFKYLGNEVKKVKKLGKVDAIILKPQLVSGYVFEDDTEMTVWATNDGNRLPLVIESPLTVGSIKAILRKYENLRHPWSIKK